MWEVVSRPVQWERRLMAVESEAGAEVSECESVGGWEARSERERAVLRVCVTEQGSAAVKAMGSEALSARRSVWL